MNFIITLIKERTKEQISLDFKWDEYWMRWWEWETSESILKRSLELKENEFSKDWKYIKMIKGTPGLLYVFYTFEKRERDHYLFL